MYRVEKREVLDLREVEVVSSLRKSYEKDTQKHKPGAPDLLPGYLDRISGERILGHEQESQLSRGAQAGNRGTRDALWLHQERIANQTGPLPYKPARWLLRRESG